MGREMCSGGIGTADVCVVFYDPRSEANIVPDAKIIEKINMGVKQFLPIVGTALAQVH